MRLWADCLFLFPGERKGGWLLDNRAQVPVAVALSKNPLLLTGTRSVCFLLLWCVVHPVCGAKKERLKFFQVFLLVGINIVVCGLLLTLLSTFFFFCHLLIFVVLVLLYDYQAVL